MQYIRFFLATHAEMDLRPSADRPAESARGRPRMQGSRSQRLPDVVPQALGRNMCKLDLFGR